MPQWKDISFNPNYDNDGWNDIPNPSDGPTIEKAEARWNDVPNPSDEPSLLSKGIDAWDSLWFNQPISKMAGLDLPAMGRKVSNYITDPNTDFLDPVLKYTPAGILGASPEQQRGFLGGSIEGASSVAEGFTSPLNVATLGLGMRAQGLMKAAKVAEEAGDSITALRNINNAQKLITADKAAGALQLPTGAAHAYKGYEEGDPTQMFMGVAEMAGGTAAMGQSRPQGGSYPYSEPSGLERIDPSTGYKNLPTTQDLNFNPHAYPQMRLDSPGREILQDTASDIETKDRIIQGTVESSDMPLFDVDPFQGVQDTLRGMYIGEDIPRVDLNDQQVLPTFDLTDLPPRDVPPTGPNPASPDPSVQLSLPLGERGPGTADFNNVYTQLRQMLGRDPSAAELEAATARSAGEGDVTGQVAQFPDESTRNQMADARLQEQIGVSPSSVPTSPVDVAVNNVLHAWARNPNLPMTEVTRMLSHLSPEDARRAQTIIVQMTMQSPRNRARGRVPDPLETRPTDPAWEETPEEAAAMDWPPGSNIVPEQTPQPSGTQGQLPFGPMSLRPIPPDPVVPESGRVGQPELPLSGDYRDIREADPLVHSPVPGGEGGPRDPIPTVSIGGIIDRKKQELGNLGYDPSGMTGWEADMALQRVNRAREVPPGEQMMLGLEDQMPAAAVPESDQVRQKDVLKVATLMEAGMAREAQQIRALHDMYGRPITPSEEAAALADHYSKLGDVEKAAQYSEQADRYSAVEQGQQDMFNPTQMEGGADIPNDPNRMSEEWQDEQNGRIPPKGPLGIRPGHGKARGMVPEVPPGPRQREAVRRQQGVDEVIRLQNKVREMDNRAKAAMDSGNPELAQQHSETANEYRRRAATANMDFAKQMRGKMLESERFESMARAATAAGDDAKAARFQAQAETEYLREAGQMELRFRKNYLAQKMQEMGFTLSEKTMQGIDSLDPADLSHALQKDFAELVLAQADMGKPGLTVLDDVPNEYPHQKETHITIRNQEGKPIAHAEMRTNRTTGEGDLINWAVDQDAGMGQQNVLQLAHELEKRGGLVPKGPYSTDTKNFLQRLVAALRSEKGATPIFTGGGKKAGGKWWDTLRDRAGWGQGYKTNKRQRLLAKQQVQWIDEALAMPANMTTTGDLSAPGRQGLMLFHTPEFWNAIGAMFQGIHPKAFDRIDAELKNMRIMRSQGTDPKTGKPMPSMAEKWGMKMFAPASKPGPHARGAASNWLETGRFFNQDIPYITKGWAKSPFAMIVRGSNRAFITFANHLNVNRLQYLADRAQDNSVKALSGEVRKQGLLGGFNPSEFRFGIGDYMPDVNIGLTDKIDFSTANKAEKKAWNKWAEDLDPYRNTALGKELADAVNTMTGHAPLKTHLLPFRGGELNLEKHARLMGRIFHAPGLLASRVRMMNPLTYVMASPQVRKQYVGGLFGAAAGYTASALLLKNAAEAMGYDAEINLDLTSADAFKIRVGNYRMDPTGGIGPYLVLYSRLLSGYYTSSATGQTRELGQGYQATTAGTLTDRFLTNKQEPVAKFVSDMLAASEHQPVYMKDRMLQMMAPLIAQDIYEISKEDPGLIPLSVGTFFGHSAQVYKRGVAGTRFTDPENEWVYAGGGARGLLFGADFQNQPQRGVGPRKPTPRQLGPKPSSPRPATPRQF